MNNLGLDRFNPIQPATATVRHSRLLENDCKRLKELLETNGFQREVANEGGGKDFELAVEAIKKAFECGRGLLVLGLPGCGKTSLVKALFKIISFEISRWIDAKSPNSLQWLRESSEFYMEQSIFIDDLGAEEVYHEYGNVYDVVGDFVQRFHYGRRNGAFFYATSNLGLSKPLQAGGKTINGKYGSRVYDRLCEDCVVLMMHGKSKRQPMFVF